MGRVREVATLTRSRAVCVTLATVWVEATRVRQGELQFHPSVSLPDITRNMDPISLDAVAVAMDVTRPAAERSRVLAAALGIPVNSDGVSVLVDPREEVVLELMLDCVELARGLRLTVAKAARLVDLHRQIVRAMGGTGGDAVPARASSARPLSPLVWATPSGSGAGSGAPSPGPPSSPGPEGGVAPSRGGVGSGTAATGRSAATSVAFSVPAAAADTSARPRSAGGAAAGGGAVGGVTAHLAVTTSAHTGLEVLPALVTADAVAEVLERGLRRLSVSGFDDRDAGAATHLTLDEVTAVWK